MAESLAAQFASEFIKFIQSTIGEDEGLFTITGGGKSWKLFVKDGNIIDIDMDENVLREAALQKLVDSGAITEKQITELAKGDKLPPHIRAAISELFTVVKIDTLHNLRLLKDSAFAFKPKAGDSSKTHSLSIPLSQLSLDLIELELCEKRFQDIFTTAQTSILELVPGKDQTFSVSEDRIKKLLAKPAHPQELLTKSLLTVYDWATSLLSLLDQGAIRFQGKGEPKTEELPKEEKKEVEEAPAYKKQADPFRMPPAYIPKLYASVFLAVGVFYLYSFLNVCISLLGGHG